MSTLRAKKMVKIFFFSPFFLTPLCQAFTLAPGPVKSITQISTCRASTCIPTRNSFLKLSEHSNTALSMSVRSTVPKSKRKNILQQQQNLFGLRSLSSNDKIITSNHKKWIQTVVLRVKHIMAILFTASILFLGSASIGTKPSHASSTSMASSSSATRLVSAQAAISPTENLDKIIQNYVEDHMFDDEQFDPFESALREAYADQLAGDNPVKDIITNQGMVVEGRTKVVASKSIFSKIKGIPGGITDSVVNWAEKNTGLDPKVVRLFVAVTTVTVLPVALLYATLSFGGIFRKGMMRGEVKRYGNRKDLTADEKEEPDEEDEDDDDDDDDDGDGDDE